ncbi:conjugal transfer protein TrbL family protein, partial [Dactylosporangium matsuzakiense]|uniref:conjugal transfer protein TrbL family protein n=1 Tax=Dactylosporangium matsuzakiense TaxID=53360 RepID=UPI0022F32067
MTGWLLDGAVSGLLLAVVGALNALWGLLSSTVFSTPDVSTLPQVTAITSRSMLVVNTCFVLAIIAAGIMVMINGTVPSRSGAGELLPRLVIGWIAANFAVPVCQTLVEVANALTAALTGETVASQGSFNRLEQITLDSLSNPPSAFLAAVIGVLIAVLTGMLLVTWIVRIGVLIVLVGISPIALACHASPVTDGAARLWWRSMLAIVSTVVLQALALHVTLSVLLDPAANAPQLGLPHDTQGTFNLFVVVCLLWTVIKIPGLLRQSALGGGGRNVGGMLLRLVSVQQLTSVLRRASSRAGRGRATAAGRGRGTGGGRPGGGGGLRMPRPLGGPKPSGGAAGRGDTGRRSGPP